MDKDTALKLALEHIEGNYTVSAEEAIAAIKEALAQPEQESDDLTAAYLSGLHDGKNKLSPQRKPLTDEQIDEIYFKSSLEVNNRCEDIYDFARAIEAAHGIKENT